MLFSHPDHHRHNILTHCTLLFFWEEHLTQMLASFGPHATLVGSSGPAGTTPLLKVDTGKSRQLDDCFRNYRSDQNGFGAQKTSWRGSEALLHAFGQWNWFFPPLEHTTDTAMICCESGDIWWPIIAVFIATSLRHCHRIAWLFTFCPRVNSQTLLCWISVEEKSSQIWQKIIQGAACRNNSILIY